MRTAGGTITGLTEGIEPQRRDAFLIALRGWRMRIGAVSRSDMKKLGGWFSMGEFGAGMPTAGRVDGIELAGSRETGHWSWSSERFTAEVYPVNDGQTGPRAAPRAVIATLVAASRAPTWAPACTSGALRLRLGSVSEATGQNSLLLRLTNTSSGACALDGYPRVVLRTASGTPIPFRYRDAGDQMVTPNGPFLFVLVPGENAFVLINKYRCDAGGRSAIRTIAIAPPDSATFLRSPIGRSPALDYCGPGDPGSVVSISPFEPTARLVLAH